MGRTSDRQKFSDKHSNEYVDHRKKNNDAVQKSRTRSRQKSKQVVDRIKELTDENKRLEGKIKELNDELKFLQNVFKEKRGSGGGGGSGAANGGDGGLGLDPTSRLRLDQILNGESNNDVPSSVGEESDSCDDDDDEDSVPDFETAKRSRKGR